MERNLALNGQYYNETNPRVVGLAQTLSAITGRWCVDGLVWCRGGFTLEGVGTELVHPLGLRDVAFSGLKHKKLLSLRPNSIICNTNYNECRKTYGF